MNESLRPLVYLGHVKKCEIGGFHAIGYSRDGELGDSVAYVAGKLEAEQLILANNCHDELVATLADLATAAERREVTMGDQCDLIECKANLECAAKNARTILAKAKGESK